MISLSIPRLISSNSVLSFSEFVIKFRITDKSIILKKAVALNCVSPENAIFKNIAGSIEVKSILFIISVLLLLQLVLILLSSIVPRVDIEDDTAKSSISFITVMDLDELIIKSPF